MAEEAVYSSRDPGDALYNTPLNSVKRCMECRNVLQHGVICEPIGCFGTGRGRCEYCRRVEFVRFQCCQEAQKEGGGHGEAFREITRGKGARPEPMAGTLAKAFVGTRYDDEVPF